MTQPDRLRHIMLRRNWVTLRTLARLTGYPVPSISAALRTLRRRGYFLEVRHLTGQYRFGRVRRYRLLEDGCAATRA